MTVVCIEQIFDSRCVENKTDKVHDQVIFSFEFVHEKTIFNEPKPIVELHTFKGILLMDSYNTDIFFSKFYNLQSVHFEMSIDRPYHYQSCFSFVLSTMKGNLIFAHF